MATVAIDINPDPGDRWTMGSDMAHGSNLGPDDTMASGGSVGRSDRHVP